MKFIKETVVLICALVVGASLMRAAEDSKLWVNIEYREHNDRVLFIQDRETGTRCYAITNNTLNTSGYAISCVPKETK